MKIPHRTPNWGEIGYALKNIRIQITGPKAKGIFKYDSKTSYRPTGALLSVVDITQQPRSEVTYHHKKLILEVGYRCQQLSCCLRSE